MNVSGIDDKKKKTTQKEREIFKKSPHIQFHRTHLNKSVMWVGC